MVSDLDQVVWTIIPSGFKSSSVFIGQLVVIVGSSAIVSSVISWIVSMTGRLGCFSVNVVIGPTDFGGWSYRFTAVRSFVRSSVRSLVRSFSRKLFIGFL